MKSLVVKDKILRNKYLNQELNQKVVVYVFRKVLNDKTHSMDSKQNWFDFLYKKYKKTISKTKLVKRCVLTGRSRSSLQIAGISRIKIKELIRDKKISNASKSSW